MKNNFPLPYSLNDNNDVSGEEVLTEEEEFVRRDYKTKMNDLINFGKNKNSLRKNLIEGYDNQKPVYSFDDENAFLSATNSDNNTKMSTYNLNREILLRKEELNQLENEEINNQLKRLQNLQTEVFTKERLIEENLYHSKKNENNIRTLMISFIFAILLYVIISLNGNGSLSDKKMGLFCIIILIIFLIFLMYQYNVIYMKDSLNYIFSFAFLSNVGEKIEKKTQDLKQDINKARYGMDYDTWKNENCGSCPPEPSGPAEVSAEEYTTEEEDYAPGFYYQDGSSPNQVIYPKNTQATSGVYNDTIQYTDINNIGGDGKIKKSTIGPIDGQLVASNVYTRSL